MGLFGSSRSNKSFSYEPRYYEPDKDDDLKRRMRAKRKKRRRRSPMSLLYFAGLLLFALFIYQAL